MRLDRRLANGSAPMQFSATGHGCPAATMHNRRGGIHARKWTRTGAGVPAGRGDRGAGVQEARPRGGAGVPGGGRGVGDGRVRSEEHPPELQSLMSPSYVVFCLKKKKIQ